MKKVRMTCTTRARAPFAALALLLGLLAGCDSGPEGPGFLTARIDGPTPLGAAVIEVTGAGVTGFEGAQTTHVIPREKGVGVHRVVLIGEAAGDLIFQIGVQDVRATPPVATVLSAADGQNQPLGSVQAFRVQIARP